MKIRTARTMETKNKDEIRIPIGNTTVTPAYMQEMQEAARKTAVRMLYDRCPYTAQSYCSDYVKYTDLLDKYGIETE